MSFFTKIKAGALQYVLVISVVIAVIIFAFMSLVYLQQRVAIKYNFTKEAVHNVQVGFDYLKIKEVNYDSEISLKVSDNIDEVTTVQKTHWGIFDIARVSSTIKKEQFQKIALLGAKTTKREALYLKDNNTALVLVGNTKITGNVSLPKQGVKRGNIAGTSYFGNQLIYGGTSTSKKSLPIIRNIDFIANFSKDYRNQSYENFELQSGLELDQSFANPTLIYEANNTVVLENMSFNGNIIIVSKTAIQIKSSANLQDIILVAPEIIIESNLKNSNFQAIASKKIKVGTNCFLKYPSALILVEKGNLVPKNNQDRVKEENAIHIEKGSQVKGAVVYYSESTTNTYDTHIKIDEDATITGEIYCSKNLELKGTVFGLVYTNSFLIKKAGGIYMNHLFNGIINETKLPKQYAGLLTENANAVAKWVD